MTLPVRSAHRRFLVLTGLRWLPTGLVIPVSVLLMQQRGLSLTRIGLVIAVQGVVVFLLELPTGALADTLGRRTTVLIAAGFAATALLFLTVGTTMMAFATYYGFMGVYRALDSGPLDAWYVDAALAADADADIEQGLASGGAVLSGAVAGGALLAGAAVAFAPVSTPLVVPVVIALGLQVVHFAAVVVLMHEPARVRGSAHPGSVPGEVRAVIGQALRTVRRSRVLAALIAVELFWGFGMTTFETLFPPRLAEVMDSATTAAALLGPAASAAWAASAVGAALVPLAVRRFGSVACAITGRLVQGATVATMGLVAGPVGLLAAYLGTYLIHGAANPVHQALLHRRVGPGHRTTVVSLNSMVSQPGGALGAVALGALADAVSLRAAMVGGALVLAAAAPLYLPARAQTRVSPLATRRAQP